MSSDNGEITSTNSVIHYSHVQAKVSIVMIVSVKYTSGY